MTKTYKHSYKNNLTQKNKNTGNFRGGLSINPLTISKKQNLLDFCPPAPWCGIAFRVCV